MASKAVIPFLVGMMLLTGVCNTLLTKYQVRASNMHIPPPIGSIVHGAAIRAVSPASKELTAESHSTGQSMRQELR